MIKKSARVTFIETKKLFNTDDTDVNKTLVSEKEPYSKKGSFKYFIGYNDNDDIRSLCITLPQMIGYVKCFDSNKTLYFKVIDKGLLKGYTKIWERFNSLIGKEFYNEPVYGDNKITKENTSFKFLSLIMLDSVIRANKKYYPEALFEECKYKIKNRRKVLTEKNGRSY